MTDISDAALDAEFDKLLRGQSLDDLDAELDRAFNQAAAGIKPKKATREQEIATENAVSSGGIPLFDRARGNFALGGLKSVEGVQFLASQYGPDRVIPILEDDQIVNVVIKDPATGRGVSVDPKAVEFGDLVDVSDVAFEMSADMAGTAAGGAIAGPPGAVAGGVAGSIIGNVAKQAIGASLPGEAKQLTDRDRLIELGLTAGLGLAIPGASAGARQVLTTLGEAGAPGLGNAAKRAAAETIEAGIEEVGEPAAARIARFAAAGVDASPAQATRRISDNAVEKALAGSPAPGVADAMQEFKRTQVRQLGGAVDKTIQALGKSRDRAATGRAVADASKTLFRELKKARSDAFRTGFSKADIASGGLAVLPTDNLRTALESLVQENTFQNILSDSPLGKRAARELAGLQQTVTMKEAQALLAKFRGKSFWEESIKDGAPIDAMRGQLLDAMQRDLGAAVDQGVPGARWLAEARQSYAQISQELGQARQGILVNSIESLRPKSMRPGRFLKNLLTDDPKAVSAAMNVLEGASPEIIPSIRASAADVLFSAAGGVDKFSPSKFRTVFGKQQSQLKEIFAGDPEGLKALSGLVQIADELAPQNLTGAVAGAQTAAFGRWMQRVAGQKVGGPDTGPVAWVTGTLEWLRGLGANKRQAILVELISNPQARAGFAKAAREARRWPNVGTAITGFLGRLGRQQIEEKVFDFRGVDTGFGLDIGDPNAEPIDPNELQDLRGPMFSPNANRRQQDRTLTGVGSQAPSLKDLVR
ncbi:MAG: hypothetical protein AAF654_14970 [Myxococcota bacterium]